MKQNRPQLSKRSSTFTDVRYSFTIMLLGDSCTGKTCLLIRYKDGTFMNNNFISTVGIDYRNKLIEVDKCRVKLQIFDTAGQERFRSLTNSYYRDADALILLYDITNRASFENVRSWLAQAKEYARNSVEITLCGNKTDLVACRRVKAEEGRELANVYNIAFMETSAKTGQNIHETFVEITRRLIAAANRSEESDRATDSTIIDLNVCTPENRHWYSPNKFCCAR